MTDQIMKGRAKTADRDALLARITPSADYADLAGVDLVVEAVFEDPKVKAEAIAKAEAVIGPDCIFGSNTSTLPITGLAGHAQKPDQFIGIHFFSPVEKMLLVEIIMAKQTGDRALAVALDFVRAIKKTPIVVNDARGFYANRCVGNYIREGHLMLMEGVPAAMIENVARMAGMPVGPLSLNDEVAIDLGLRILRATKAQVGADAVDPVQERLLVALVEEHGRLGRKNAKGFYDYPEKGKGPKTLWPGLAAIAGKKLDPDTLDVTEMKQRLLVTQALEAARSVEEGIVTDPREADVGSIIGFGFAPYTGGTLSYIDGMGAKAFVALCDRLAAAHGLRFAANALLREMAEKGETFYGRVGAPKQAAAGGGRRRPKEQLSREKAPVTGPFLFGIWPDRQPGSAVQFGQQVAQVEPLRHHGERAVGGAGPLVLGLVPVKLDAVLVGIAQIERLADAVVAGAVELQAGIDHPLERVGKVTPRRVQERRVEQAGGAGRRRPAAGALPGVQSDMVVVAAGRQERRLPPVELLHLEPEHPGIEADRPVDVGHLQVDMADARSRRDGTDVDIGNGTGMVHDRGPPDLSNLHDCNI